MGYDTIEPEVVVSAADAAFPNALVAKPDREARRSRGRMDQLLDAGHGTAGGEWEPEGMTSVVRFVPGR